MNMREFRAKRIDNGGLIYGDKVTIGNRCWIAPRPEVSEPDNTTLIHHSIWGFIEVIPETVGQNTGLKDATKWEVLTETERKGWTREYMPSAWYGKEIYDGDKYKDADGIISVVKMAVDGWALFPIEKGTPVRNLYWHNVCITTQGKVIGTIHDPEPKEQGDE